MIVLMGSAPYMPEWCRTHTRVLEPERGASVFAINTAWRLCPSRVDCWMFSNDYFVTNPHFPKTPEDFAALRCIKLGWHSQCVTGPVWYDRRGTSGTMALNVLCHIINLQLLGIVERQPTYCVGCDMQYTPGATNHFYGEGSPDPLRFGEEWLDEGLRQVHGFFRTYGLEVFVGQSQYPTRLPFEVRALEADLE